MRRALAAAMLADSTGTAPAGATAGELEVALALPELSDTGLAMTPEGRLFVPIARILGSPGPRIVECRDDGPGPCCDAAINGWHKGADPRTTLARVNSMPIGPDGHP